MNAPARLYRVALCLVVASSAACAAPIQNGGVIVRPHAEERLDVMCRYRATDAQHLCVEPAEE